MVDKYSEQQKIISFYDDLSKKALELGKLHGVNIQPMRVSVDGSSIHIIMTGTTKNALEFYGDIWNKYRDELGLPEYIEPGMNLINPETGEEWILIGLDPISSDAPVRVMDSMLSHYWIDINTAKDLQPM